VGEVSPVVEKLLWRNLYPINFIHRGMATEILILKKIQFLILMKAIKIKEV
jgi:hypothetical protein